MSTKQSFKEPWSAIEDYPQGHRVALEKEAFVEIAEDHPLYGLKLYAVARRDDCDDVLFQVTDSETVVVVHLTWSRRVEPSPHPRAELYESIEEFKAHRMEADALRWE